MIIATHQGSYGYAKFPLAQLVTFTDWTHNIMLHDIPQSIRATDNFEGIWVFNPIKIYSIG